MDAETLDALAKAQQSAERPVVVEGARWQGAANVMDAQGGQHAQVVVPRVPLMARLHEHLLPGIPRVSRSRLPRRRIASRGPGQGGAQEASAIHGSLLSAAKRRIPVKSVILASPFSAFPQESPKPRIRKHGHGLCILLCTVLKPVTAGHVNCDRFRKETA